MEPKTVFSRSMARVAQAVMLAVTSGEPADRVSSSRCRASLSRLVSLGAVLLSACPPSPPGDAADSGAPLPGTCADGFAMSADGIGCEPVLPAAPCPAGTRARLGERACVPVGWTSCPAGFQRDPSGWGCAPVLPAARCAGATRAELGSTLCVPVGDCSTPFPPVGATHFVDPFGPLDATHFHTLSDALTAAPSGAVIAVESGTYAESLLFTRDVSVVGRCPEKVILSGAGSTSAGLRLGRPRNVSVAGLSIVDHETGLAVAAGTFLLQDMVFSGNRGLTLLAGQGAHVTVSHSVLRDTVRDLATGYGVALDVSGGAIVELDAVEVIGHAGAAVHAYQPGTRVRLTRSIVSDTAQASPGIDGRGFAIDVGAQLELSRSAVLRNHTWGLFLDGAATVSDSVIADTRLGLDGDTGRGIHVTETGQLELTDSAVTGSRDLALFATGADSRVTVTRAVLRATLPNDAGVGGMGFSMRSDAPLVMADTAVVGNVKVGGTFLEDQGGAGAGRITGSLFLGTDLDGVAGRAGGVVVGEGYHVLLEDVTLERSTEVGLYVEGRVEAAGLLVLDSVPAPDRRNGVGAVANLGGALRLERSVVSGSRTAGLEALNSGSRLELFDTCVLGTQPQESDGRFGHALIAEGLPEGGPDVTVERSRFSGGPASGGLVFAGASARISGSLVDHCALGLHVQQGSTLVLIDGSPDAGAPLEVDLSTDTRFVAVTTRVGAGEVPLPGLEAIAPPP